MYIYIYMYIISYLEIYNEDIYDLLSKKQTSSYIHEKTDIAVYVKGFWS